jgi:hypothetical protein
LEPHWDPATFPLGQAATAVVEQGVDSGGQSELHALANIPPDGFTTPWWQGSGIEIARATRSWIQYGTVAFAVICIIIGAVEGLAGR